MTIPSTLLCSPTATSTLTSRGGCHFHEGAYKGLYRVLTCGFVNQNDSRVNCRDHSSLPTCSEKASTSLSEPLPQPRRSASGSATIPVIGGLNALRPTVTRGLPLRDSYSTHPPRAYIKMNLACVKRVGQIRCNLGLRVENLGTSRPYKTAVRRIAGFARVNPTPFLVGAASIDCPYRKTQARSAGVSHPPRAANYREPVMGCHIGPP